MDWTGNATRAVCQCRCATLRVAQLVDGRWQATVAVALLGDALTAVCVDAATARAWCEASYRALLRAELVTTGEWRADATTILQ